MGSILLGAVLEKNWMHPGRTSASMHPHPDVRHLSHIPHLMAHASIARPLIWLLHSPSALDDMQALRCRTRSSNAGLATRYLSMLKHELGEAEAGDKQGEAFFHGHLLKCGGRRGSVPGNATAVACGGFTTDQHPPSSLPWSSNGQQQL